MSSKPTVTFASPGPSQSRREWLDWALNNIHPSFAIGTEPRHEICQQLHYVYRADNGCTPRLADIPAWERLKAKWCPPPRSFDIEIPSAVDCEVVRLVNKGKPHDFITQRLRNHGWDFLQCCDNSLLPSQKRLHSASSGLLGGAPNPTPAQPAQPAQVEPKHETNAAACTTASRNAISGAVRQSQPSINTTSSSPSRNINDDLRAETIVCGPTLHETTGANGNGTQTLLKNNLACKSQPGSQRQSMDTTQDKPVSPGAGESSQLTSSPAKAATSNGLVQGQRTSPTSNGKKASAPTPSPLASSALPASQDTPMSQQKNADGVSGFRATPPSQTANPTGPTPSSQSSGLFGSRNSVRSSFLSTPAQGGTQSLSSPGFFGFPNTVGSSFLSTPAQGGTQSLSSPGFCGSRNSVGSSFFSTPTQADGQRPFATVNSTTFGSGKASDNKTVPKDDPKLSTGGFTGGFPATSGLFGQSTNAKQSYFGYGGFGTAGKNGQVASNAFRSDGPTGLGREVSAETLSGSFGSAWQKAPASGPVGDSSRTVIEKATVSKEGQKLAGKEPAGTTTATQAESCSLLGSSLMPDVSQSGHRKPEVAKEPVVRNVKDPEIPTATVDAVDSLFTQPADTSKQITSAPTTSGSAQVGAQVERNECRSEEQKTEPEKTNGESKTADSVTAKATAIIIPDGDEKYDMDVSSLENTAYRTQALSTGFTRNLRPILRDLLRDGILAMSKSVMDKMRNRTGLLLGRPENAHFGFATLRDVEAQTIRMLEAEVAELSDGFIEKLDGLDKDTVDVKIKRCADELEEGEIVDEDRQAKRQRNGPTVRARKRRAD